MFRPQDPDSAVVAVFKHLAVKNEGKTTEMGRPIFDDWEVCELRYAGSRNVGVYPATSFSHWASDPATGEQIKISYAERFAHQYRQFKAMATQTKTGTPLAEVPFMTEAKRAEYRALNIYTVEALAAIDGAELKNLGNGGRDMKNKAIEYLEEAKGNIPNAKMVAELEALRSRNQLLEEDVKRIAERKASNTEDEFDEMTREQLHEYVTTNTGIAPQGNISRKTLVRMAVDCRPKQVA